MNELKSSEMQTLKLSLSYDDVLMSPRYSDIKSRKDVDLSVNIKIKNKEIILRTPIISSPMDTVTMSNLAIKMSLCGGIGIIHRFLPIEEQVLEVMKVKRYLQYIIIKPYTLKVYNTINDIMMIKHESNISTFCVVDDNNKLLGLLTNRDLEYGRDREALLCLKELMTPIDKIHAISIEKTLYDDIINNKFVVEFNALISSAKNIMIKTKVEKIPIVEKDTNLLLGLITWKNVRHYENNKSTSCVDEKGRLAVGAAIGINESEDRLKALLEAEVDVICVDVANGANKYLLDKLTILVKKYPNVIWMGGNVCTERGVLDLAETGVKIIRLGIGNGGACETRKETGIGKMQFSCVNEAFDVKKRNNLDVLLCSDGGTMGKTASLCLALASGCSLVMLGRTLAACEESPGFVIYKGGKKYKYYRGMASSAANLSKQIMLNNLKMSDEVQKFNSEGTDGYVEIKGSVVDVLEHINNGIRSSMSYLGAHNIDILHKLRENNEIEFNIMTNNGQNETNTRVIKF